MPRVGKGTQAGSPQKPNEDQPGKAEDSGPPAALSCRAQGGRLGVHRLQEANSKPPAGVPPLSGLVLPRSCVFRLRGAPRGMRTREWAPGLLSARSGEPWAPQALVRSLCRPLAACLLRTHFPGWRTHTRDVSPAHSLPAAPLRATAGLCTGPPPVPWAHAAFSTQTRQRPARFFLCLPPSNGFPQRRE